MNPNEANPVQSIFFAAHIILLYIASLFLWSSPRVMMPEFFLKYSIYFDQSYKTKYLKKIILKELSQYSCFACLCLCLHLAAQLF